ncbi:O-antigen ligase family protein [Lutibacter flavus]|uniref:O-antigen ligase n=1 Tax=Lutibacter flavus TaxID=691689 RepID=A0A238VU27_9FLAO|nr:O-antigen ligase family protein [Lutibacter flavus]SNR36989.1 O-antigen ligase [Lutibacter flavus]
MITHYLIILSVGIVFMIILDNLKLIKNFRKSFYHNKQFFWSTVLISLMLFIPYGDVALYDADSDLGASRIFRLFGFGLLLGYTLHYIARYNIFPKKSLLYVFLIYVFICFFSASYSPNWIETVWKSFELLVLFLLALLLKNEIKLKKINEHMIFSGITYLLLIGVLFSLIGYLIFPNEALQFTSDFEGDIEHKSVWGIIPSINPNSLGQFSAMLSFVGFYYFLYLRKIKTEGVIFLIIGLAGQLIAYSRTSIFAFAIIIIFLIIQKKNLVYKFLALCSLPLIYIFESQLFQYISRGQDAHQLSSMSGRTYMWQIGWESILENPILGLGYYSGHKTLDINIEMAFSSLDSTYLETLVDVGVVGSFFLFFFIFKALYNNYRLLKISVIRKQSMWIWVAFGYLVIMIIRSLSGPTFQVFHIDLYFLLLIVISQELRNK